MAISKRTRYEVLKRDNFTCRYCRSVENELTIDHVVPTALGGSDKPDNLVAACKDCNAGKSSTSPDDPLVEDVRQKAIEWGAAIAQYNAIRSLERKKRKAYTRRFNDAWEKWSYGYNRTPIPQPSDWEQSIWQFYAAGLPIGELEEAVNIACGSPKVSADSTWRYMCGVVYRKLEQMNDGALALLEKADG